MNKLNPKQRETVSRQLEAWRNEAHPSESGQIAENITHETAFTLDVFTQLLADFAKALASHPDPLVAWEKACEAHNFEGKALAPSDRPVKLGRASKFDKFLQHVKTTDTRFKATVTKYAGHKTPPSSLVNILNAAPLGGSVIFATFNDADSSQDPFVDLPWDQESIRTALGLGHFRSNTAPFLLFRYHSSEPPDLPLHRPTIADAGSFSHFRPERSTRAKWGRTCPIPPNSRGLPSMPEVIHKQIAGDRLDFPYQVTAT